MPKMTGNYGAESNDRLRQPSSALREKYELAYRNARAKTEESRFDSLISNPIFLAGVEHALESMAKLDGYELHELITLRQQ
jgi:hypothetical protein